MTFVAGFANFNASTPAVGVHKFLDYLVASVGWTLTASSDGSGAAVTTGASGAGGLDNTSAYMEVQDPGATYRMSWQRGSDDRYWRVRCLYGSSSGGTATQIPAAAGAVTWLAVGGGTDGAPTYEQLYTTAGGALVFHGCADNAAFGTTGVYQAWMTAHAASDPKLEGNFLLSAVDGHPDDTYCLATYAKHHNTTGSRTFAPPWSVLGSTTALNSISTGKLWSPYGPTGTPKASSLTTLSGGATANFMGTVSYNTAQHAPWAWDNTHARAPFWLHTSKTSPVAVGTGLKGELVAMKAPLNGLMTLGDTHDSASASPWVCVHDYTATLDGAGVMLPWVQSTVWSMT